MITQAKVARGSWGKERSSAGKATFTIERSSEAMNAPMAVTTKTVAATGLDVRGRRPRPEGEFGHGTHLKPLRFIMQLTNLTAMERKSFADMDCSVAQCLEVVGEWWSMLIVRDAFLGVSRFEEFQRRLGISRNILQQRLDSLVDAGVLARVPYCEHPPRDDYRLTDKGRDLWPVLTAMRQWGDRYASPSGPPLQVIHKSCGSVSNAVLVCDSCGERVGPRDVEAVVGPGREDSALSVLLARRRG